MEVALTIDPDDFNKEAYGRCIAAFMEIVERPDDVRITITTDFVGAVREKVSDPDYAAVYQQERRLAVVGSKVIPQEDGTVDFVVPAGLLSKEMPPGVAERAFRHEALHVAIHERGESLNNIRVRHGIGVTAPGLYLGMGGVACEEYRVERTLWDQQTSTNTSGFGGTAEGLDECIREATERYKEDGDVGAISMAVKEAVHATATWSAYVAAECDDDEPEIEVAADVDERVLGAPWRALVAELRRVPAADVPTDLQHLDVAAARASVLIRDWVAHIGFLWRDDDEDLCFRISDQNPWGL